MKLYPDLGIDEIIHKLEINLKEKNTKDQMFDVLAETVAYMTMHHHYGLLAGRIFVRKIHKNTQSSYKVAVETLFNLTDNFNNPCQMVSDELMQVVAANAELIQSKIDFSRDLLYDFFAIKTLEKSYLLKDYRESLIERPQFLFMRVAIGIHGSDLEKAFKTYDLMSLKKFTHASPTMFNAGTPHNQMSSCFLVTMEDDSIKGIYNTVKKCAMISKYSGGIGLSISNIRATGSLIKGTGGNSTGIIPMLKVFNNTARYINQGGGKRMGSFGIYLEPWHLDIMSFLKLKKNHGKEEERARDLFYGLWIPDLFMERVKTNSDWTLFCPDECKLQDLYGEEFNLKYQQCEADEKIRKVTVKAQVVFKLILESQIETGTPYILYKDACNQKSNQKNLGTIRNSNLCTEIIEYCNKDEIAVCNLASICIKNFVKWDYMNQAFYYDFDELHSVAMTVTENLNIIIDKNFYPLEECKRSNMRHRPIGLGVQGLADLYAIMKIPFESDEALKLGKEIFECIYHAGLSMSCILAKQRGSYYETFPDSPLSQGKFQFDLWSEYAKKEEFKKISHSGRYDWELLRKDIQQYGVVNSLIFAPMPTAATAQIMGNNESIEPFSSHCYTRRVLSGEFIYINKYLIDDLIKLGIWNDGLRQELMTNNGSISKISGIPDKYKELYKTVYEMRQKRIVEMAAHRGVYVDQSQSLNIYFEEPTFSKLTSLHMETWKLGLKTGMYYLRSKGASNAIKFTLDQNEVEKSKKERIEKMQNWEETECIGCGG